MTRKALHHYSELNTYQFVTFRTQDSVDAYLLGVNENLDLSIAERQMNIVIYRIKAAI